MDEEEIKIILKQFLAAVAYLHAEGVCHRDLKPDNLMIKKSNKQVKLMDFNISRRFMDGGQRQTMRTKTGLDQWSAPETRQMREYTESVDMWGVGVVLYFMLMKCAPFIDDCEEKLIEKV